jgi:hypothetical protein
MAETFEYLGLLWFENRSEHLSYYFLPRHADVQRDDRGGPMVSLLTSGTTGFLMLTAEWQPVGDVLDGLRKEIAERRAIDDPATIRLAFAPVRSVTCDLVLDDGAGAANAIATHRTSGSPPYSAPFNVALTEPRLAAVVAGLNGRPGFLTVEYHASVVTPVPAGARLIGAGDDLLPWLRSCAPTGAAGLRAGIEQAIVDGLASVVLSVPAGPSAALVADLYDHVVSRAVELVPAFLDSARAGGDFEVEVTVVHDAEAPVVARADLATIAGRDLITLPTGTHPIETVPEAPRWARFGFDPGGAPLAWVRLRRGESSAVLAAPDFAAVELAGAGPVHVTAGYTDGSPTYQRELPAADGEVVLTPGDLGLVEVTVDGRQLARDGAVAAEVWLTYRPRAGREHRHTLRLGGDTWTARWWLVAPAGAGSSVDYRWSANTADQRTVLKSHARAETASIVLSFSGGTGDVADRQSSDR